MPASEATPVRRGHPRAKLRECVVLPAAASISHPSSTGTGFQRIGEATNESSR
jgi:hypothetical protein